MDEKSVTSGSVFFVKIRKEMCHPFMWRFSAESSSIEIQSKGYYCKKNKKNKNNILYVVIQMNLNQTALKRGQPFADNLIINQVITLETPT